MHQASAVGAAGAAGVAGVVGAAVVELDPFASLTASKPHPKVISRCVESVIEAQVPPLSTTC